MNAKKRAARKLLAWGCTLAVLLPHPGVLPARAGGPLNVGAGGTGVGTEGVAVVFANPAVTYTTDGGFLGRLDNAAANARVAAMFQIWADVPSARLTFMRSGPVDPALVADGDVDTIQEFNALDADCPGNPIIFDRDGSLFSALGRSPSTLGFAGPCRIANDGTITSSSAALNGDWIDGDTADRRELTDAEFDGVFIHEFGHLFGMDHSQINRNCLDRGCSSGSDDTFGLPTMFPITISGLTETPGAAPESTLSPDDIAWVSFLYPEPGFAMTTGTISGQVLYSDGVTGVQGVNVIARQVDDPGTPINESRRNAVSVVSGFRFTEFPGNPVLAGTPFPSPRSRFGSTNPAEKGAYLIPGLPTPANPTLYRVEIEPVDPGFTGGSSVGPFSGQQIPPPGPIEFFGGPESASDDTSVAENILVSPGIISSGRDIMMNGTPPRFDSLDALARNETRATATPLPNGTFRLSLSSFPDEDFYSITATAGTPVKVEVLSSRAPLGTGMDGVLEILDANGARPFTCRSGINPTGAFDESCLQDDIDLGVILDPRLEFMSASDGAFFIHVSEFRGDARPDFIYDMILSGTAMQPASPANDGFAGVVTAPSAPFAHSVFNSLATIETADPVPPCGNNSRGNSVWYRFTAPAGGTIIADTLDTSYNTILSVWTGGPGAFNSVACNDDFAARPQSRVSFAATSGTTYFFMVSAADNDGGIVIFRLNFQLASVLPPANRLTLVPHSVFGGGFLTRVFISNMTNASNAVIINRVDQTGAVVSTSSATLAPAGTLLVADGESQRGQPQTVQWFAIGSQGDISASILFDFDSQALNLAQNFRTAVGALSSAQLTSFTVPIRVATANVTVGIALANLSGGTNVVVLKLLNQSGALVAQDMLSLGAFAQTAFSIHERPAFSGVVLAPTEFVGALLVTTTDPMRPVAAIGVGNNLGQLFSLPVTQGVSQ